MTPPRTTNSSTRVYQAVTAGCIAEIEHGVITYWSCLNERSALTAAPCTRLVQSVRSPARRGLSLPVLVTALVISPLNSSIGTRISWLIQNVYTSAPPLGDLRFLCDVRSGIGVDGIGMIVISQKYLTPCQGPLVCLPPFHACLRIPNDFPKMFLEFCARPLEHRTYADS